MCIRDRAKVEYQWMVAASSADVRCTAVQRVTKARKQKVHDAMRAQVPVDGTPGCGKTTLARAISQLINTIYHSDISFERKGVSFIPAVTDYFLFLSFSAVSRNPRHRYA